MLAASKIREAVHKGPKYKVYVIGGGDIHIVFIIREHFLSKTFISNNTTHVNVC